jgi:EAL domain-containing protein (putative c-di-GMP-specific phosphodiesterase class I)
VGFNPESLLLEIGQSALLSEMPIAWESLARLRLHGIRLALGDIAQDSLTIKSACRIPITEINLDIGYARESVELRKPESVTRFIDTAKASNLQVLADHVHTQDDLDTARDLGCDFFRGNLAGQAMPQIKMIEWLGANL